MFSWLKHQEKDQGNLQSVVDSLKKHYKSKLRPLEEHYLFDKFHSPLMSDADFAAKPMVLLVGQYSTGKTTFIKYLLEQDFPGLRIGPEPTTDSFIAVMHGDHDQVIPGNALISDECKQFHSLGVFGNAFLNRLYCSQLPNKVLESITIIDTPGILSGQKQSVSRGYDFTNVLKWFAERADRIILLFDAHKLDISDEFQRGIDVLREYDVKIRIVLNKADTITSQQLMKVHGALMWSLGKVINTPEVPRVYIGSFWNEALQNDENRKLFEAEAQDLFSDLQSLPHNATLRKLNDFIKRARLAKVHAYIISSLKEQMPSVFGKTKKMEKLINNLREVYEQIQKEHNISPGDFPPVSKFQDKLRSYNDFSKLHKLNKKLIKGVDKMLANEVSQLLAMIPHENESCPDSKTIRGGAFALAEDIEHNPFSSGAVEGAHYGSDSDDWVIESDKDKYDKVFETLDPNSNGKVSGSRAKRELEKSKLPKTVLGRIWKLSDLDHDGMLDSDEFAVAMYLIDMKLNGKKLPDELPISIVPPSKRREYCLVSDEDST